MDYSYRIYDSICQVPCDDWQRVCGCPDDPFMDPRFILAVETSLRDQAQFWPVLVYDSGGRPVACACLCLYRVDGALLSGQRIHKVAESIRRVLPGFMRFKILFCGLPVSGGQSHLRLAPEADRLRVLSVLDEALYNLARQSRVRVIVFKEFGEEEWPITDSLEQLGYLKADSLPMNHFDGDAFGSFDEYFDALRSHYRYKVKRSRRKFKRAGLRVVHRDGAADCANRYTDEVHELYEAVVGRAEVKLEILPAEFFREMCRQFPSAARFTFVYQGEQIVAFAFGLLGRSVYRNMFIGLNYDLNEEADLYFNLMYENLNNSLRQGVSDIHVGQTSDTFKSRLGCTQRRLSLYVKARGLFSVATLHALAGLLFPPIPTAPARNVFRSAQDEEPQKPSGVSSNSGQRPAAAGKFGTTRETAKPRSGHRQSV